MQGPGQPQASNGKSPAILQAELDAALARIRLLEARMRAAGLNVD